MTIIDPTYEVTMRTRLHKGLLAHENFLLCHNPALGEHVRDGRFIRESNDCRGIKAATKRCEARVMRWNREA